MEQSQVDETAVDESVDDVDEASELSKEDLLAEVQKLRREAGGRRVQNKALKAEQDAKLAEYEEWKKSQMTETERLKVEKAALEQTAKELLSEKRRTAAAIKLGLDLEDIDLIKGDTEEEVMASAKRLAARLGVKKESSSEGLFPGKRGKPVGSGAKSDPATAFNAFMRGEHE